MGGSSSSSTRRTYNTTNLSQQGDGNVAGDNNRITIQRADALTLDRIADALASGVDDLTTASEKQTGGAFDAAEAINRDSLDLAEEVNRDSLDFAEGVNRDSLDSIEGTTEQALSAMESVARQAQQASEEGTQGAMDFVSNYTERAQIGSQGEQLRTLQYVAAAVAVALVGIAWASRGKA